MVEPKLSLYIYYIYIVIRIQPVKNNVPLIQITLIQVDTYTSIECGLALRNRKSPFRNVLTADTPTDQPGSPIVLPMVGLRMNKLNERCSKVFNLTVAWETI